MSDMSAVWSRGTVATLLRGPFLAVWAGLIAATLLSSWLGIGHEISSAEGRTILIMVVAFIKVRFVGLYFMELKDAPSVLRGLFEAYCLLACGALTGFYLFA